MRSVIGKTAAREISQKKGQFIAILTIVALGAGIFAGLKDTEPSMKKMAGDYFSATDLHDLRLLSTLGFTDADEDYFAGLDDVKAAQGSYSFDMLAIVPGDKESVLKVHSLTDGVDRVVLRAGRMPENGQECVADHRLFGEEEIGGVIRLSEGNDSENLENFTYREYTIVGIVQSPRYIHSNRGNTDLGTGKIDGFIYLPKESFAADAYTEMTVRFWNEDILYSEEYDNYIDAKTDDWEDLVEERAEKRRTELFEEETKKAYQENLPEVEDTIKEEKEKAKEELEQEVEEAFQEIIGEQIQEQVREALEEEKQKQLAEGYQTIDEEIEKAEKEAKEELWETILEEVEEELPEAEGYVLTRDSNVGYVSFENDSTIVSGIANVFPIFFFLVAALICMTTMNRMVEEQRTQIGVWKALGYSNGKIMLKYLCYSGSAALFGVVIGFFCGTYFFPKILWNAYEMLYCIGELPYVFSLPLAMISLVSAFLASVGVTVVTLRNALKENAADLMRPKSPKAGKRVWLEYLTFFWKRLKFLQKVSLRNIFRYKRRLFMMVLGVGGCTALLVTGFGVKDSIAHVADQQFGEIQLYDISVTYQDPVTGQDLTRIQEFCPEKIDKILPVAEKTADLEAKGELISVTMVVTDSGTEFASFVDLHTQTGEKIAFPKEGEAVISDHVARRLGISVGDSAILRDEDNKETAVQISGISENYLGNYIYLATETYERTYGKEAGYNAIYVNGSKGQDLYRLSAELMSLPGTSVITVNQDTLNRFTDMMKSLDVIVFAIIICAAALAFVVHYNLTNINITERVREIATIKVLGFFDKETAVYVFGENLLLTMIGAFAGLPLGFLLHRFVMQEINVDLISFDVHIRPLSYGISFLLTILFSLLVSVFMRKKVDEVSMTESLKSVD